MQYVLKCVILASLVLCNQILIAEDIRTIAVVGTAESKVKPDIATMDFYVMDRRSELNVTKNHVNKTVAEVVKAIAGAGVDSRQIRTSTIRVTTYFEDENSPTKATYFVERSIGVTCPISLTEAVITAAILAGANKLDDIDYSVSNQQESQLPDDDLFPIIDYGEISHRVFHRPERRSHSSNPRLTTCLRLPSSSSQRRRVGDEVRFALRFEARGEIELKRIDKPNRAILHCV